MKKLILTLAAVGLALSGAFAQWDSVEYDRATRYPSAGSIGVGIEGSPILNFVGNMFNGNTSNHTSNYWDQQDYTVYMRYFLLDELALRGTVRFNPGGVLQTKVRKVSDDATRAKDPLSNAFVEDRMTEYKNDWRISVGAQYFRGRDRLKGFFGGDVFYQFKRMSSKYEYGNVMNVANPAPYTINFDDGSSSRSTSRVLEQVGGPTNTIGLDAFTGVEYYFLRQMCVGFEVGVCFSAELVGRGSTKEERVEAGARKEFTTSTNEGDGWSNGNRISFQTVTPFYGNFYFMFHF